MGQRAADGCEMLLLKVSPQSQWQKVAKFARCHDKRHQKLLQTKQSRKDIATELSKKQDQ